MLMSLSTDVLGWGGVALDAAPLAEVETVIVGIICLMDAESKLPVESLESVHVYTGLFVC